MGLRINAAQKKRCRRFDSFPPFEPPNYFGISMLKNIPLLISGSFRP